MYCRIIVMVVDVPKAAYRTQPEPRQSVDLYMEQCAGQYVVWLIEWNIPPTSISTHGWVASECIDV